MNPEATDASNVPNRRPDAPRWPLVARPDAIDTYAALEYPREHRAWILGAGAAPRSRPPEDAAARAGWRAVPYLPGA